jgi:hypothetical protein
MRRSWSVFFVVAAIACTFTAVAATLRTIRSDKRELATASAKRSETKSDKRSDTKSDTVSLSTDVPPSDSHVVRLLSPADSEFDSVLDSVYPGLRSSSTFEKLRPNTILVSNESGQPVHAFVIKWTSRTNGAAPIVTYTPYLKSAGRDRLVTGGVVLAANEVRLLSPSFAFFQRQSFSALSAQIRANVEVADRDAVISSSIDGVVFQDGTFAGPDEARLQDRFECERSGQHDEGYSMTLALRNQLSDDEIAAKLNEHIQKGWTYRGRVNRESFYHVSRGNEAQLLLQLLKQGGRTKFQEAVTQLLKMPRVQLRRL